MKICYTSLVDLLTLTLTVALTTALFVLTQTTIVTIYGPTKAIKGDKKEDLFHAYEDMEDEQTKVFKWAQCCVSSIFLGACVQTWVNMPLGLATIL